MRKLKSLLLLPALLASPLAYSAADTLTFAGTCSVSLLHEPYKTVGTFSLEAKEDECPAAVIEFRVPGSVVNTDYGVYAEFQRSEFGAGMRDKAYLNVYPKKDGGSGDAIQVFNAQPGNILNFEQELVNGARLYCTGKIR
jgi:hypothetical protein